MVLRREVENIATAIIGIMVIVLLVPILIGNVDISEILAKTFTIIIYFMLIIYIIRITFKLFNIR
ncbi:MAG: hypothetical protein V1740_01875 [Candidatus Woesearchaeota archaeon]